MKPQQSQIMHSGNLFLLEAINTLGSIYNLQEPRMRTIVPLFLVRHLLELTNSSVHKKIKNDN